METVGANARAVNLLYSLKSLHGIIRVQGMVRSIQKINIIQRDPVSKQMIEMCLSIAFSVFAWIYVITEQNQAI
jgi:hypothetical protein